MLRFVLPAGPQQVGLYFVVDEVSGAYRHRRVKPIMSTEEDDEVWAQLEEELAKLIAEELAKDPRPLCRTTWLYRFELLTTTGRQDHASIPN